MMASLRGAWRALGASPVASVSAVLSLALGLGGVTALFSLLNAVVLRPLPVERPDQLVILSNEAGARNFRPAVWADIRERGLFTNGFAWVVNRLDTSLTGERRLVDALVVSGGMFPELGVHPALGRLLGPDDDQAGGSANERAAVISYHYWQQQFGGAPDVLGRTLTLQRQSFTIVGVTEPAFQGTFVGLGFDVATTFGALEQTFFATIMARLASGESVEQLTAAARAMQPAVRDATALPGWPPGYRRDYLASPFTVRPAPGGVSMLQGNYETPLRLLLALSIVVLLMACGNIALLLTARASERWRELAIRAAIGASRLDLARQCLVEAALLTVAGLALGAVFAAWAVDVMVAQVSNEAVPIMLDVRPDWRVLTFAGALAAGTALLSGLAPMWRASRVDPIDSLRQRGGAYKGHALARTVLALQVSMTVLVLSVTGLLVRSVVAVTSIDTGFDASRLLVSEVDASEWASGSDSALSTFGPMVDAVRALPGVEGAGLSMTVPAGTSAITPWLELEDGTALPTGMTSGVFGHQVTDGWLKTLGTELVAGRDISPADRAGAPRVALVNETFVRRFLGNRSPVGTVLLQRDTHDGPAYPVEIVGVTRDAVYAFLKSGTPPTFYTPLEQLTGSRFPALYLSVRAVHERPALLTASVSDAIQRTLPGSSFGFRTLADQVRGQYARERLLASIATAFGLLGLVLVALGLYGVTSSNVAARTFEFGVRMALGATHGTVLRNAFAGVVVLVAAGLALGVMASVALTPRLEPLLFEVPPIDRLSLGAALVVPVAVALLAALVPARRVTRVDPVIALRAE